ncbi:pentapeptide repeat-containing protein, partial [Mycobacterium tuberculosis]
LMSGNFSNGILWRGNYEGLFSYSYSLDVPRITILDAHFTGAFGPVVVPPIPVPAINAHLTGNAAMGAFTIPQIDIPALNPNVTGSVGFGPIAVPSVTIPALTAARAVLDMAASVGATSEIEPFIVWTSSGAIGPTWYSVGRIYNAGDLFVGGNIISGIPTLSTTGPVHAVFNAASQAFNTPALNIHQIPLGFQVPGSIDAITLFPGGLTFPANSLLNLDVFVGTPGATIPAITFPEIPANADGELYVIAGDIPLINIPTTPGIGNTTTVPSSGFFNTGAGGGSGFGNFGANMSGWWNQAHTALAGAGSGIANVGTLHSGVLNLGSGLSGIYNTSTLPLGTPALVSGLGNVGDHLSGLLASNVGQNPITIVNIGLANVGNGNVGLGNIGNLNLGAANIGDVNLGFGNIGDVNLGFGNIGGGNVGFGN